MSTAIAKHLDLKGLACPLPIVKTAQAIKELTAGDLVEVEATDPGSVPDFAAWTASSGHELVEQKEEGGVYTFLIRKKG